MGSDFAGRVAGLRAGAGWSLRATAARLGVSHAYLSAVEHGRERPSPELVVKLAGLFGVDIDDLAASAGVLPPDLEPALRDPEVLRCLRRRQSTAAEQ